MNVLTSTYVGEREEVVEEGQCAYQRWESLVNMVRSPSIPMLAKVMAVNNFHAR